MTTTKRKKGETAERIYKLLHRNPDLTTSEISEHLSDLPTKTVHLAVSRMRQRGEIDSRGGKVRFLDSGRRHTSRTYHVKYNVKPKPRPKTKPKVKPPLLLNVEAPKDRMRSGPVVASPTTPVAEREVLMVRRLDAVSESLRQLSEQNELMVDILRGTLDQLVETQKQLDKAETRRNWWDVFKGWFS